MAPPYRDKLPRIEWDEVSYERESLVTFAAPWYSDPNFSYSGTAASPGWFQTGGGSGGVFAWLNGFVFGSHTPRDEKVGGVWTGLGSPGDLVQLRGQLQWSFYSYAVGPFLKIYAKVNGQIFDNWPATFTWEDGWPTTFTITSPLDGVGGTSIEFGIFADNGVGSASINATLTLEGLFGVCEPLTTSYRLDFPYPIEDVRAYRRPRASSSLTKLPSRFRSGWLIGHDGVLEGEAPWIPAISDLALPLNDGWEDRDDSGTVRGGWSRFLRHARPGGAFTFYPDKDDNEVSYPCVWLDPSRGKPELADDMVRMVPFGIRTTNGALIEGYSQ